jgi:WD40 repeat protein
MKAPWVERIAISSDGKTVATAGYIDPTGQGHQKAITIRDLENDRVLSTLTEFRGSVNSLAFSPTRSLLVSGDDGNEHWKGANGADGTLKLWDVQTGRLLRTFVGLHGSVTAVAFSPTGTTVASRDFATDGDIKLWNVKTGSLLRRLTGRSDNWQLIFSPEGNMLASEDGVWDVNTAALTQIPTQQQGPIAFSADGRILAITGGANSRETMLKLWDVNKKQILQTVLDSRNCTSISFSPNNRLLAAACLKTYNDWAGPVIIKLWNVNGGALITSVDSPNVSTVLFSDDNTLLTFGPIAAPDAVIKFWDISKLK